MLSWRVSSVRGDVIVVDAVEGEIVLRKEEGSPADEAQKTAEMSL